MDGVDPALLRLRVVHWEGSASIGADSVDRVSYSFSTDPLQRVLITVPTATGDDGNVPNSVFGDAVLRHHFGAAMLDGAIASSHDAERDVLRDALFAAGKMKGGCVVLTDMS